MDHRDLERLAAVIRRRHGGEPTFQHTVRVRVDVRQGQAIWEGPVAVFSLKGHPKAKRCYAWFHKPDGSPNRPYVTILGYGEVDSPDAAAKAAYQYLDEQPGPE